MSTALEKIEARIEAQRKKLEQLAAKKRAIETRKTAEERKKETRRKVLLGAYVWSLMESDQVVNQEWILKMDSFLKRDDERALFDLPSLVKAEQSQIAEAA